MNIVNNVVGGVEKNLKEFGFIPKENVYENDQ